MKTDPAASCRFFTAEDACRVALQAYYSASRAMEPPEGEPWVADGSPYAAPSDFASLFVGEVQARVALLGLYRHGAFEATVSGWDLYELAGRIAPEKIDLLRASRDAESAGDEVDFSGHELHGLPPDDNAVHNQVSSWVEANG